MDHHCWYSINRLAHVKICDFGCPKLFGDSPQHVEASKQSLSQEVYVSQQVKFSILREESASEIPTSEIPS